MSEKSNPFKGIPSLFSRSSKKHDKVAHQKSIADGNPSVASKSSESQLSEDGRKLIADSNLFDASWYLRQNPDVAAAQIAPLEHYFTCGESEGRNPGPDFDVAWYTGKYPEFVATGFGALEHYLRFGCLESKSISLADYRRKLESDPELSGEHRALRSAAVKVYTSPPLARRINLVVDSMFLKRSGKQPGNNSSSESIDANENLDSNNSRGLQIAVLLSAATEASLRVVTRVKSAEVSSFKNFLLADNLPVPEHVEFVHCDYLNSVVSLPVSRWDVFITVDEPNDASIRCSIDEKNIFALAPTAKSQQIIGDNLAATLVDLTRRCESVFV